MSNHSLQSEGGHHLLETRSLTTVGNAVECVPLFLKAHVTRVVLVSSEFCLARARYIFEAVLLAHRMLDVTVKSVPAPTPPPRPDDIGLDAHTLVHRLFEEVRHIHKVDEHLLHFCPPSMRIPPLSPARKAKACVEVLDVLANTFFRLRNRASGMFLATTATPKSRKKRGDMTLFPASKAMSATTGASHKSHIFKLELT